MVTLDTLAEQATKMDSKREALIMALNFLQVSCSSIHIHIRVYRHDGQYTGMKVILHVAIVNMCNIYVIQYSFA